ncbi:DUF3050 domain-containing protein [Anatilimnocola floriformis]|uniref:DUF3050 domain-containing protein n=1 Tax=Anatilimnocola floriformis TaxID=2948575 RepID=UPI0020C2EC1B|nr:DUF3050 domain-containing protein [Anatilimnocola floriformis]
MSARFEKIQLRIAPLRAALLAHPIYERIDELPGLRLFMQHHVFAVWDFMSLLKALQRQICCVSVPWLPPADGVLARFINEIVLGEESDEDGAGGHASHFELYHRAMRECGADTGLIGGFLQSLKTGSPISAALANSAVPASVQQFVGQTFAIALSNDLPAIAAAFTFGREDLLPAVFQKIVDRLHMQTSGGLSRFQYYLARHIELDGDHHGPLSIRLTTTICGDDEGNWQRAEQAAVQSLEARLALWDGMLAALP